MNKAEGFAAIPNWMIRDESVSLYAVTVYGALASHSGPGGIHPSQATLAREARCSERKVRDALSELESLGVVTRVRRKNSKGRAPSGYALHPNGQLRADEEPEEVAAPGAGTSEVPAPETEVPAHDAGGSGTSAQVTPLIEEEPSKKNPVEEGPRKRGTRIPDQFIVSSSMRAWAGEHTPLVNVNRSTTLFVNYWRAKTGRDATKLDWERTWQNWLLKDQAVEERRPGAKQTTIDHGRDVDAILRERRAARESQNQLAVGA